MSLLIIAYAVFAFISLLLIVFLMLTAPWGWEDKKGFHKTEKKDSK